MGRDALYLTLIVALLPRAISAGCNKDHCTSPDAIGGYDCWAGSSVEPCTCSEGKAKETGGSEEYMGQTYYEYVCCTDGSGTGEQCGDFKESDEVSISTNLIIFVCSGLVFFCVWVRVCMRALRSHKQQPISATVELAQQTQEADSTNHKQQPISSSAELAQQTQGAVPDIYKTPSNYYR